MATPIILHPFIFYFFLGFIVILFGVVILFLWDWLKRVLYDTMIFIDKSNRWSLVKQKLKGLTAYTYANKKYFLTPDSSILNNKGKALFIFSENKPTPLKLSYNKASWLTSESLTHMIDNEMIKKLSQISNPFKDGLILLGAVGGLIAGISSVLILLKTFGVI